jgi:hypothetical protein
MAMTTADGSWHVYRPKPIRFDRLRSLERPYSWVPFRLLSSGLLAELSQPAKLLYFFLCLVADRRGMSFYGDRRVHEQLALSDQELSSARYELCDLDLLAFDGRVYQLLSWPPNLSGRASTHSRCSQPSAREIKTVSSDSGSEDRTQHLKVILEQLTRNQD